MKASAVCPDQSLQVFWCPAPSVGWHLQSVGAQRREVFASRARRGELGRRRP